MTDAFSEAFTELEEHNELNAQDILGITALEAELKQAQTDYLEAKSRYEDMLRRVVGVPRS